MGKKLDLSRLTDDEAKHIWEVIQRDFDLRKKEEERLEELRDKIEKESMKRELLSGQAHFNETLCIHCMQPFKFLLNRKHQCLDCQLYTCKSCSQFNRKEQGWVCHPCCLSRIVKTRSLGWYYEHVRTRFKRFGSVKVMRSLYGRMSHGQKMNPTFFGLHDRAYSLPDVSSEYQLYRNRESEEGETSDGLDGEEAEYYAGMRKTKRLLSVHPFDFETDSEYSAQTHHPSVQLFPDPRKEGLKSPAVFQNGEEDSSQKESVLAEAELAAVFSRILQEQRQQIFPPKQEFSTEVQFPFNSYTEGLERTHKAGHPWNVHPQDSADLDTSDEVGDHHFFNCQAHHTKHRRRASYPENGDYSGNQILELNRRISAIESMLSHLEERILVHSEEPLALQSHTDRSTEEKELKRKLKELASNSSEKALSSDEETAGKKAEESKPEMCLSSDYLPPEAKKVSGATGRTCGLPGRLRDSGGQADPGATTEAELSELEDKVASAAAQVQHSQREVSEIESRIAALSAAGLTVKPVEKLKKKSSIWECILQPPRNSYNFVEDQEPDSPVTASPDGFKVMSVPHVLRRKFNISHETTIQDTPESFARNSYYTGSLTQRNPNGRNRKADRIFGKPVMTHE